ncbi:CoA-binding protein [Pedococcus soli]
MLAFMSLKHQNDPELVRELLVDPGIWVVVGLSNNQDREAFGVSRWLKVELGKGLIPVHPRAETVHGEQGYATLADIPDGTDIKVVDCFVNSEHVGALVDEVIAQKDRLQIDAIWMQLGVADEAAAARAREAGLGVVMDTCPRIEWRTVRSSGMAR